MKKADPKEVADQRTAGDTELVGQPVVASELAPRVAELEAEPVVASELAPRVAELEAELVEERRKHELTEAWAQQCAVALSRLGARVPLRETAGS